MTTTTKATQLKQTLCFRSLRLMDKNYLKNNLKSFSDSEIDEKGNRQEYNVKKLKKCLSENDLFLLTKENENESNKTSFFMEEFNKARNKSSGLINLEFSETSKNSQSIIDTLNKELSSELKQWIKNQSDAVSEMSNPYQVLEGSSTSEVVNENILGEPRCLAIKKYSGDFNPFLTDDLLIFEPDFEDENIGLDEETNSNNMRNDIKTKTQIKDMFVDYEDISCEKKNSSLDREEGELSPEIHQVLTEANKNGDSSAKLNAEFFQKINECLLDLDKKCRELYSSSTPESAMKQLQRTISNVDSIKRKLTFLVSSKNSENEKKRKLRKIVEKYYVSRSTSKKESERNPITRVSRSNIKNSDSDIGSGTQSRLEERKNANENSNDINKRSKDNQRRDEKGKKSNDNSHEKRAENHSKYGHRKRNSRDKLTQAYLLNRKKVDVLEKLGTKKEIQRIKSLFERQMSLITKHVIQEKETSQDHNAEKYRRRHNSQKEIDKNKETHEKIDLNGLHTLEDMEAFLNTLKTRTNDKILSEQFIRNERKKKLLMFTSKRDKNTTSGIRSDKIKPLALAFETTNDSKAVLGNLSSKENLAVTSSDQKNQISDLKEFKMEEVYSEVIPKQSLLKETHDTSAGSKTLTGPSSNQLAENKTSKHMKSDSEKQTDRELNQTHLEEDVVVLKPDEKSSKTANEANTNSSIEPRHKSRHAHKAHDVDHYETVKRKRNDQFGSEHDESQMDKGKQISKRKRTIAYVTSPEKSTVNDNNLDIDNSQSILDLESEKEINKGNDSLIKDLFSKKIFILDDDNLTMNNQFCLKVINNEVYLKKISSRHRRSSRRKTKPHHAKKVEENLSDDHHPKERQHYSIDAESTNLEDMENFLQELRSKKKMPVNDEGHELTRSNPQCKELKFLAKIRAKRKAKLMACVSDGVDATEKEAKFLKSLEKREGEWSDSSDIESRKQKLMEKMRAEVDAIVFAEKPSAKLANDDPFNDVKNFLNMIKKVESVDEESSKQVYVSFSLKRSDVKRLESLTSGKSSSLTEESQKFLNSVRAKMRAKKAPVSDISSLMQKPED